MGRVEGALFASLIILALGAALFLVPKGGNPTASPGSLGITTSSTFPGSTASESSASSLTTTATNLSAIGGTPGNYSFINPEFYVASDGNDAWSGTIPSPNAGGADGPFATLQRAKSAADSVERSQPARGAPVGIEVEGGVYSLQAPLLLNSSDSGTAGAPIVYEGEPGSTAVISGGRRVMGWTQTSGNEWEAPAPGFQYFEQMWKNGQRIYRPSTTNGTYLYVAKTVFSRFQSQGCSVQAGTQYECFDRFQFGPGDLRGSYYAMNHVEVDDFECWTMPVLRLQSVDLSNDTAFLSGTTTRSPACHGFITGHRYLVKNVLEYISPGQWYFDEQNQRILYMAHPGEDPNTENFVAPQLQSLVLGDGVSHVEFLGLTFSYSNWVVPAKGWTSPQGEELTQNEPLPAAINLTRSSYVTMANDTFSHVSAYALAIDGTGNFQPTARAPYNDLVVNSRLYDLGGGGVVIGRAPSPADTDANVAQYDLVWNSVIAYIGRFLPGANGVYILNSHNNVVGHDVVYGTYSNAVSVGGSYAYNERLPQLAHDNTIEYVLAFDINQGVSEDGGALYTAVGDAQGNVIRNDVVHDVVADLNSSIHGYGGWGIYFDSTSQNVVAEDDLVYRTSFPSIHQNDGFNNTVTNSILAFGGEGIIDRTHDNASSIFVTHDIIYYDSTYIPGSMQRGVWDCSATCRGQFTFLSNLYWYTGGTPSWYTGGAPRSGQTETYTFHGWQALGEDAGSAVADPLFADTSASNFTLPADSPAFSVGFMPFAPSQAGLIGGASYGLPTVPQSFQTTAVPPSGF